MYSVRNQPKDISNAVCPKCGCKRLIYGKGKLTCSDCSHIIGKTFNKYGAKRTEFNGKIFDSKFEANVAQDLETRKLAGDIKNYETQYKVEIWCHRPDGEPAFKVSHKVDFRIHENDGSFTLLEAKGVETSDYKMRRKFLENIWLPMNPDHSYEVIKQGSKR